MDVSREGGLLDTGLTVVEGEGGSVSVSMGGGF